jgi:hypothetical protein
MLANDVALELVVNLGSTPKLKNCLTIVEDRRGGSQKSGPAWASRDEAFF